MSPIREFNTLQKQAESGFEGAEPITFALDGEEITAYPPKDGQLVMLMTAQTSVQNGEGGAAAAGIIDFLDGVFEEDGKRMLRRRLMAREDPFGMEDVIEIVQFLIEGWTARPTESPRGSTPSRQSTGGRSTAKPRSAART